jgi:hypothetical protein
LIPLSIRKNQIQFGTDFQIRNQIYFFKELDPNQAKIPGFIGFAYQGKDIVFRFIIEYSSLRDFGPLGNNNRSILIQGFLKVDILALC